MEMHAEMAKLGIKMGEKPNEKRKGDQLGTKRNSKPN
jgi:hypothetical protein